MLTTEQHKTSQKPVSALRTCEKAAPKCKSPEFPALQLTNSQKVTASLCRWPASQYVPDLDTFGYLVRGCHAAKTLTLYGPFGVSMGLLDEAVGSILHDLHLLYGSATFYGCT